MENQNEEVVLQNEKKKKKSLKWLWITLALVIVAGIGVWCSLSAIFNPNIKDGKEVEGVKNVFNFGSTFVLFTITFIVMALGYLLGGINIKGISLGTAGVFLIAILVGFLCTLIPENAGLFSGFH